MAKRFIRSDYIDEDNQSVKENTSKNKIFSPSINDVQPIMQNKAFNPTDYKSNNGSKNKIISPLGAVENTAPLPSINNKTYYSNKGTPIKFSSTADDKASKAGSVAAGLTNGASLGIIPKILDHFQPGMSQDAEESNKLAYNIGNMAGYLAPGIGGTKLVKPLLKGITNPLLNRVLEGAAVGAGMTGIEDKVNGKSWEDTGKDMGINAGIGAGADLLLHGLGKAIPKVISKFKPSIENNIAKDINIPSNEPKAISPLQNESSIKSNITPLETTKINPSKEIDYDKIDDPKVLEKHIAELETALTTADEPTGLKMNLQLFAAKKRLKKIQSKVYSNTFQKTDVLSQAEKELLNPKDFQYDVKTEKASLEEARQRINNNITKEVIDLNNKGSFTGADTDTAMGILEQKYLSESRKTNNYSNTKDWIKNIARGVRESGRGIQALAKYSRTKEGKLIEAQRAVDNVEEGLKKTNPKLLEEINTEAKKVEDTLNTAHKDAVEEVAKGFDNPAPPKETKELLPSEMLANKIKSTVNPKSPQEKSLIDKMVSELFSVAKESPIDTKLPETKPSALSSVSEALNNRQLYSTVWNNAKKLVTEQFKDNPEAMAILNNYFEKGIKPPFSMSKFNTAFNEGIKDLNINMGDVVRNYYKTGTETKEGLIDYLVKKSGLSGDEAKTLANTIDAKFREVKKQKSEEYLKGIFKEKTPSKVSNPLNKIEALSNTGGFVNENYKNKVKEKLTPELRKLIGFNPKETVAKAVDKTVMSFEDIVRGGVGKVGVQRKLFLDSLKDTLNVNPKDAETILKVAEEEFNKLAKDKQTQILKNMFKEREKPQQKNIVDKVMELINLEAYDKEAIRDLIKEKKGLPVLNGEDIKFITDNMEKSLAAPEGSYEQRMYLSKVSQLIAEKEPSTGQDKLQAAQRIAMLFNPKTAVVRNPTGNMLLNGMETLKKNTFGVPLDKATTYIRNIGREKKGLKLYERTQLFNPVQDIKESAKGFKTGIDEWKKDIINGVDTSPVGGGVEIPNKVKIFDENANNPVQRTINKSANKVHFVVGKALKLGDTPFYNAAYSERLAELKKIKGTDIITDAMKEDANLYGLERTLQNDSALASLFTGMKGANFLNKHPGAKTVYQTFANLILPFAKTPANVLDKFLDYSPVGILKATGHAISTMGKSTVEKQVFNQKKFVDTMARGLTGTGLATLGYLMAQKGLITGAKDKNNKVESLENSLGKQNYAFKVGNNYQTVDWALPASAPLMMGADIYNSIKNTNGAGAALMNGAGSAVNLMFNSTLLQGPSKLTGGYNPAASIGNALLGTTTQATPTIGKQISQLVDPYVRETYDPNPFKQTLNKTIARIPFASKTLPAKVDNLGNEIKAFQGKNNIFNVMFNPGFNTKYEPTEVQKEIVRLYEDSGETKQLPPTADKIINATKGTKKTPAIPKTILTGKELSEYQKLIGKYSLEAYNDVISSSVYSSKTDEEKATELGNVLEKAKAKAKLELLKGKGVMK